MLRLIRYRRIKAYRKKRDEILSCQNNGRALTLMKQLPNIKDWSYGPHDEYYGSGHRITIFLAGGFSYHFSGYGNPIKFIRKASQFAYLEWVKSLH
jgi:hypothetical protein